MAAVSTEHPQVFSGQRAEGRPLTRNLRRTQNIAVITVVAPIATVIFSFPASQLDMEQGNVQCDKLDQCS